MKRLTAVAALVLVGLAGCGTPESESTVSSPEPDASTTTEPPTEAMTSNRVKLIMFGYPADLDPLTVKDNESCDGGMDGSDPSLRAGGEVQVIQGREIVDRVTLQDGRWRLGSCTFMIDFQSHPTGPTPEFVLPDGLTYPISQGTFEDDEPSIRFVS